MITPARMAAVDANAAALGVPRKQLMESSGAAVARAVRDVAAADATVAMVCGRGNNGGDAMVAARFLDDLDPTVHLLGRPGTLRTDITRENWDALRAAELDARIVRDSRDLDLGDPDVAVDAMLGTGATGAPREPEASAVRAVNGADAAVVSVDVPTGVDAATGEAPGVAVDADRVVTFHDDKPGLADLDAAVTLADIGIPDAAERLVGPGDLLGLDRDPDSHKGENGEVLVVGGGPYTGAPALAARAAGRAGADLVRVACPSAVAREVQGFDAGLVVRPFAGDRLTTDAVTDLLDLAAGNDAVVIGPGLGDDEATRAAVGEFLDGFDGRAVVDADALGAVPEAATDATLVCTPHAGELAGMGFPVEGDDRRAREAAASRAAADLGATVLLKGRHDVSADGERTRVNRTGTPAMTVGGTGDVLAGATAALLCGATGRPPLNAAAVGAHVTGLAGELAAGDRHRGLSAADVIEALPAALGGEAGDRI
ncbi:MAG: NAD(P)H-hydrate dehydratase [Haloferacaceae archaeon]